MKTSSFSLHTLIILEIWYCTEWVLLTYHLKSSIKILQTSLMRYKCTTLHFYNVTFKQKCNKIVFVSSSHPYFDFECCYYSGYFYFLVLLDECSIEGRDFPAPFERLH